MLVVFKSVASADITMFGDVAESLLKMMGQSGQVPGAILAPEVEGALKSLKKSLESIEPVKEDLLSDDDAPVSLGTRAQPVIKLLESSITENADVIWEPA